tara:strand:- start:306 stop:569 length:264 start_codon:yes stop_codon:yes gene_type:complete
MADEECPYSRFVAPTPLSTEKGSVHFIGGSVKCLSLMRDGVGPDDGVYNHADCDSDCHQDCSYFKDTQFELNWAKGEGNLEEVANGG